MERYILANLERVFGEGGQVMTDEEKEIIKEIDNKPDEISDDKITINLLYQKVDILENIIKGNECVIETMAHNEEVLLEALEKKEKIINKLSEQLAGLAIWDDLKEEPKILTSAEEVIKYFEKEED